MPLALEPNETFDVILESDKDKPRENQPRFIYQYLTCRQWRHVGEFDDRLQKIKKDKTAGTNNMMDEIVKTATTNLISWVNMVHPNSGPIPFDIAKFEDIVTMPEAQELIAKILAQRPSFLDKKKLDSQPESGTEGYAKDAEE